MEMNSAGHVCSNDDQNDGSDVQHKVARKNNTANRFAFNLWTADVPRPSLPCQWAFPSHYPAEQENYPASSRHLGTVCRWSALRVAERAVSNDVLCQHSKEDE